MSQLKQYNSADMEIKIQDAIEIRDRLYRKQDQALVDGNDLAFHGIGKDIEKQQRFITQLLRLKDIAEN